MIFNSFQFLWLFPLIFGGYYLISYLIDRKSQGRGSNILLLCTSYALYAQYAPLHTLVLLWVTAVTYFMALSLTKATTRAKAICWVGTLLGIAPLLFFKYYNFLASNIGELFGNQHITGLNWAVPIGISFFTFQAVGYLIDVYKKRITAERDFLDYALFVSFFPQILSGPISKASELLPQIKSRRTFSFDKAVQGLKWLLWGMFLKTVLADRLGLYVDSVFNNYAYQSGISCMFAAILYALQIYGDFAGYSLMAIGVGRLMGFDLINNFRRPYFANSITEFWRRWHISLTRWLTTYIYIGLGGSHCSKIKHYFNIIVTFLVSGIWHGANWTFIVWGLLHGVLQCIEKLLGIDPKGRFAQSAVLRVLKPVRILITFSLVTLLWILFRMPTIASASAVVTKIFTLEGSGLFVSTKTDMAFIFLAVAIVFVKEFCEEYVPKLQLFNSRHTLVRWCSYVAVIVLIMLCGVFDSSQFIYVKF